MSCLQIGDVRPEKLWEKRSVIIRDKDNSLLVSLWNDKARGTTFAIGDMVKFRNVQVHHYNDLNMSARN